MSCPDCFTGSVHNDAEPEGTLQDLYGYRTYIAQGNPSKSKSKSKSTILFLPDAFGLKLVNNKLLADHYARETGCRVLLPDIIPGGGMEVIVLYHMDNLLRPDRSWWNPWTWVYKASCLARAVWHALPFIINAKAPKVYPSILKYARQIKRDITPDGGKLGVAGFCWGGYAATNLCTEGIEEDDDDRSQNLIDASFNAHPSFLKLPNMILDGITKRNVPYSCAVAENDHMLSGKLAEGIEAELTKSRGGHDVNTYEFKIYKGCSHGFAIRANPDIKVEARAAEDAALQAVEWFGRYLT